MECGSDIGQMFEHDVILYCCASMGIENLVILGQINKREGERLIGGDGPPEKVGFVSDIGIG